MAVTVQSRKTINQPLQKTNEVEFLMATLISWHNDESEKLIRKKTLIKCFDIITNTNNILI